MENDALLGGAVAPFAVDAKGRITYQSDREDLSYRLSSYWVDKFGFSPECRVWSVFSPIARSL
jgi:hypothetical protein